MTNYNNNSIVSLGCRLNIFESELIKEKVDRLGLQNCIIVNTCTVTGEAHRQSIQTIRKLKKANSTAKIIVTGCASQIDPDSFVNMPEVSKVIGNMNKLQDEAFLSDEKLILDDFTKEKAYQLEKLNGFSSKTKAFIQIQQGCDHRCSFCIIPTARGGSKSVKQEDIIAQIAQVVTNGHQEVILTGVDISSWHRDVFNKENSKIGELCMAILKSVKSLKRLRLSSLDPAVEDKNILYLLRNEERFMPHLHLSLQAMSTPVLRNMGRRHSKESATDFILNLQSQTKNLAIGADIICGFPRETDEQFLETLVSLQNLKLPFLHVFPYSERKGTVAQKMRALPKIIRKNRATKLRAIAQTQKINFFKTQISTITEILAEQNNLGYTKNYCPIEIIGEPIVKGKIYQVKITNFNDNQLLAHVL